MRCPRLIARSLSIALAAVLALVACAPAGPRDVHYGEEACGYCRMTITDRRFGGQAMSARGRVEAFDSIECLADYVNAATGERPRAWVTDFQRPGTFIPADSARFVRLARASSPMGAGLAAVSATASARALDIEGTPMTWAELLADRLTKSATGKVAAPAHGGAHAD
jgi:copper chaperone NosL